MSETNSKVDYEARDGVAIITLNDPPANTYSYEMMQQLDRAILDARMDDSVQVIVITGHGDKFFCAGADIQMLANVTPTFKYYFCLHANETLSRLEQTPKLVIAAINGHCVGGGLEVAMAADIRAKPASRRLSFENRVLILALATGLPGIGVASWLLWTAQFTAQTKLKKEGVLNCEKIQKYKSQAAVRWLVRPRARERE